MMRVKVMPIFFLVGMSETVISRDEEELLFDPRALADRQPFADVHAIEFSVEDAVDAAASFSNSLVSFPKLVDLSGKVDFAMTATVLKIPFSDDGPAVWWEVREFFYRAGFSQQSDD